MEIVARELECEAMVHKFPEEIILDILVRLPVKSLIICTSVCKPWRSLIKSPSFIRTHLNHTVDFNNRFGTHLLLLHSVSHGYYYGLGVHFDSTQRQELYSLHYDRPDFDECCKIECPIVHESRTNTDGIVCNACFRVVGICDGLVCLSDDMLCYVDHLIIWSPSIRSFITLPKPELAFPSCDVHAASVAFYFDSKTNDYKVVRLFSHQDDSVTSFEVYSLATGLWSHPRSIVPRCKIMGHSPQAFVNGALHWLAWGFVILAFDVGSELFREMDTPMCSWGKPVTMQLSASGDGNSIALFITDSMRTSLVIWVLKEYCVKESWTKLRTLGPQGPERLLPRALCFRKSGELVLVQTDESGPSLVSLDLSLQQSKNLGIQGYNYCSVDYYEESLVLLGNTNAVSY